jgi:hypothetical protein
VKLKPSNYGVEGKGIINIELSLMARVIFNVKQLVYEH